MADSVVSAAEMSLRSVFRPALREAMSHDSKMSKSAESFKPEFTFNEHRVPSLVSGRMACLADRIFLGDATTLILRCALLTLSLWPFKTPTYHERR